MAPEQRAAIQWATDRGLSNPLVAWRRQRSTANARGIEWKLPFDDWWHMWKPYYHKRGPRKGQMVMCRNHDLGCYEVGNVRIDYGKANLQERVISGRIKMKVREAMTAKSGRKHSSVSGELYCAQSDGSSRNPMKVLMDREEEYE